MNDDEQERSESGAPIFRYEDQEDTSWRPVQGESALEEITDHVERYFGNLSGVYHEIVSDLVHIDVLIAPPTEERPYYALVTSGMSDLPMTVPEGYEDQRYAEVFILLPPDWPLSQEEIGKEERYYWPIFWLKTIARFPHDYRSWIGSGHTIPNGAEADPLGPGTEMGCIIAVATATPHEDFGTLRISDEKTINFYNLFPLYPEEMQFKLDKGLDKLIDLLDEIEDFTEVIDPQRPNVCKKKRGPFGLW